MAALTGLQSSLHVRCAACNIAGLEKAAELVSCAAFCSMTELPIVGSDCTTVTFSPFTAARIQGGYRGREVLFWLESCVNMGGVCLIPGPPRVARTCTVWLWGKPQHWWLLIPSTNAATSWKA